jgi:hypothetical protein
LAQVPAQSIAAESRLEQAPIPLHIFRYLFENPELVYAPVQSLLGFVAIAAFAIGEQVPPAQLPPPVWQTPPSGQAGEAQQTVPTQ